MKKFVFATIVSLALLAAPAWAETAMGVVNVPKIMSDSKAANSVRSQFQAKQKAFQAELDQKDKALYEEDQALVKQKDTADKAAFQKKVKDFREKDAKIRRDVREKKAQLDKSFGAALEEIQKNVLDIVKQLAAEKKLNVVVTSTQVLYNDPAMDVTDEVLKRLDAKLPTVAVKF